MPLGLISDIWNVAYSQLQRCIKRTHLRYSLIMTSPQQYPDDILLEIISYISARLEDRRPALSNLALVNRQCARLVQPLFFDHITIRDDAQGLVFCEHLNSSPHLFEKTRQLVLTSGPPTRDRLASRLAPSMKISRRLHSIIARNGLSRLPGLRKLELHGPDIEGAGYFTELFQYTVCTATICTLRLVGGSFTSKHAIPNVIQNFPSLENLEIAGVCIKSHTDQKGQNSTSIAVSNVVANGPHLRSFSIRGTSNIRTIFLEPDLMRFLTQLQTLDVTIVCIQDAIILSNVIQSLASLSRLSVRSAVPSGVQAQELGSEWPGVSARATPYTPLNMVCFSNLRSQDAEWVPRVLAALMQPSEERHTHSLELGFHLHWPSDAEPDSWSLLDDVAVRAAIVTCSVELIPGECLDTPTRCTVARQILPRCSASQSFKMDIRLADNCGSELGSDEEILDTAENAGKWAQFTESMTMEFSIAQMCYMEFNEFV